MGNSSHCCSGLWEIHYAQILRLSHNQQDQFHWGICTGAKVAFHSVWTQNQQGGSVDDTPCYSWWRGQTPSPLSYSFANSIWGNIFGPNSRVVCDNWPALHSSHSKSTDLLLGYSRREYSRGHRTLPEIPRALIRWRNWPCPFLGQHFLFAAALSRISGHRRTTRALSSGQTGVAIGGIPGHSDSRSRERIRHWNFSKFNQSRHVKVIVITKERVDFSHPEPE